MSENPYQPPKEAVLDTIRNCLSHVRIQRIVVEYDAMLREDVAKVVVAEDQLELAFADDGSFIREAAMKSGISVEIVMDTTVRSP